MVQGFSHENNQTAKNTVQAIFLPAPLGIPLITAKIGLSVQWFEKKIQIQKKKFFFWIYINQKRYIDLKYS